jgi:hypothetical protein
VHLTLGILRVFQAFSYALSFFWLDGFAVTRPSAGNANRWAASPENQDVSSKILRNER